MFKFPKYGGPHFHLELTLGEIDRDIIDIDIALRRSESRIALRHSESESRARSRAKESVKTYLALPASPAPPAPKRLRRRKPVVRPERIALEDWDNAGDEQKRRWAKQEYTRQWSIKNKIKMKMKKEQEAEAEARRHLAAAAPPSIDDVQCEKQAFVPTPRARERKQAQPTREMVQADSMIYETPSSELIDTMLEYPIEMASRESSEDQGADATDVGGSSDEDAHMITHESRRYRWW